MKIVSEAKYDEVLGVHIVGPHATDLISEACVALRLESTTEEMTRTIHPHPPCPRRSCRPPRPSTATPSTPSRGDARVVETHLRRRSLERADRWSCYRFMRAQPHARGAAGQPVPAGQGGRRPLSQPGPGGDSVGSAYALERDDIFTPLIRDLGAIFVMGGQPRHVLAQYMAKATGPTHGRDLTTHFGWIRRGQR